MIPKQELWQKLESAGDRFLIRVIVGKREKQVRGNYLGVAYRLAYL